MANSTWNSADKTANVTLTGSNLICTTSNNSFGGTRTVDNRTTGKFYWECAGTTITSSSDGVGVAILSISLSTTGVATVGAGKSSLSRSGIIYVDGTSTGTSFGIIASGTTICIACDLTGRLIWYRLGAAGNWNNSGTANPATGVGGFAIPNLGSGIASYPTAWFGATNDQFTANFGDSAFVGVVPTGFASGFPGTAAAGAAQAMAMVLA